jgi:DNA processing protein
MEHKRKVFAVPNSIYSPESFGTNRLLQTGAEVYLEPKQLLNFQQEPTDTITPNQPIKEELIPIKPEKRILPQEQLILERLKNPENPVGIRDLLDIFDGNLSALLSLLCIMELEGKVMIAGQIVKPISRVRPQCHPFWSCRSSST